MGVSVLKKLVLCFDCDGVICETEGIDIGSPDYTTSMPKVENIKKINALYDMGHKIIIFTGRGTVSGIDWRDLTERQFKGWGLKYHELIFGKPYFDWFVDDKAWNVRDFEEGLING